MALLDRRGCSKLTSRSGMDPTKILSRANERVVPALRGPMGIDASRLTAYFPPMAQFSSLVAFVASSDLDVAQQFFGDTLGLELHDERPFALSAEIGGGQLRITQVDRVVAAPYTVFGLNVFDIDATVADMTSRGIQFTRYEGMEQDDHGIWNSPSGARVAWFLDPDGNSLSLTQPPRV